MRHTPEDIHNFIDLIGYNKREAVELTERRITLTKKALENEEIKPNLDENNHIYKIIAHKGKHSKEGGGILKHQINAFLEDQGYDFHADMNNGVFLVRLQV